MTVYRFGLTDSQDLSLLTQTGDFLFVGTVPAGSYNPSIQASGVTGTNRVSFYDFTNGVELAVVSFGPTGLITPPVLTFSRTTLVGIAFAEATTGAGMVGSVTTVALTSTSVFSNTYGGLKADVMAFAEREDLETHIDTVLRPVQAMLARDLNLREAEASVALTTTTDTVELPADYKDIRAVTYQGYPLVYVGPEEFYNHPYVRSERAYVTYDDTATGVISIFTIEGGQLRVAPAPSGSIELQVIYYGSPPELLNDGDTHAHLDNAYDLYLHAGISSLYDFVSEPRLAARYLAEYQRRLQKFNAQELRSRMGVNVATSKPRPGLIV